MTPQQLTDLAAALVYGESAMRVFQDHEQSVPRELVFARYFAKTAHEHVTEVVNGLPYAEMAIVDEQAERLRKAGDEARGAQPT